MKGAEARENGVETVIKWHKEAGGSFVLHSGSSHQGMGGNQE